MRIFDVVSPQEMLVAASLALVGAIATAFVLGLLGLLPMPEMPASLKSILHRPRESAKRFLHFFF